MAVRADGTLDSSEMDFLSGMGKWLDVCGKAIYGSRPWRIYGENNIVVNANDSRKNKFTPKDIRYTTKKGVLYTFLLVIPTGDIVIKTLGKTMAPDVNIKSISLMDSTEKLTWRKDLDALYITLPKIMPTQNSVVFKTTKFIGKEEPGLLCS